MNRAKNFWRLIQAVACFFVAVVKGLIGDFAWALDEIRKILAGVKRMPDSAPGFFRGVGCAFRGVFDFLTSEESAKFVNKIRQDFKRGVQRSRGGVPLFSIKGRRVPGDHSGWQMFNRQFYGGIFMALLLGCAIGLGVMVILNFSWPLVIGFGLFAAFILFAAWIAASILGHQMRCFHLGLVGERKMAQNLERMISQRDWFVFHGVETDYGDIDHVLVCPKGVFCFEVKTLSPKDGSEKILYRIEEDEARGKIFVKRKDGSPKQLDDPDPLKQASGNAGRLHNRLREEIGESPKFVRRVVYFPGWKVEREGEHRERNEFVIGDPAEFAPLFFNLLPEERDEMLTENENQEKIRARVKKIRECLERESAKEWEEIPL